MMEMHSFLTAKQMDISSPDSEENISVRDLFEFLNQISEWIQTTPLAYRNEQSDNNLVYVWFDDVTFSEDDFWQVFGEYLVLLRIRWKIDIFGTAGKSQETVWLTLQEENSHIYAVQKTLSSHPADTIESLCLRIQCPSSEQSEILYALVVETDWKNGIVTSDWKYGSFLLEENLAMPTQNSCFCYGHICENINPEDTLQVLTFQQKIILWTGFLKDGFDYTEFEWLYNAISKDVVLNRMEWELSLHTAMQNLKYTIQVSQFAAMFEENAALRRIQLDWYATYVNLLLYDAAHQEFNSARIQLGNLLYLLQGGEADPQRLPDVTQDELSDILGMSRVNLAGRSRSPRGRDPPYTAPAHRDSGSRRAARLLLAGNAGRRCTA